MKGEMKSIVPSRTKRRLATAVLLPLLVLSLLSASCTDADVDEWVDVALDWLASPDGTFTTALGAGIAYPAAAVIPRPAPS